MTLKKEDLAPYVGKAIVEVLVNNVPISGEFMDCKETHMIVQPPKPEDSAEDLKLPIHIIALKDVSMVTIYTKPDDEPKQTNEKS